MSAAGPGPDWLGGGLSAQVRVTRGVFSLDVDIAVAPGEIVSVLGPNGAGKSTLLDVLAGLLPIESGRVELAGAILDDPGAGIFRRPEHRPVGVVFQDYRLFPHQSVLDNVAFGPRSRGAGRAASRLAARRWLGIIGMADFADRRPAALSGGQAQRAALARALAAEPKMLLLDEPLAALDAQTRRDVQSTLRSHLRSFDGPVVIVTHDPVDALLLADRLIIIEDGQVRQDASPDEVATRPATAYVAQLLDLNLYRGTVLGGRLSLEGGGGLFVSGMTDSDSALAVLRPSAITVHRHRPTDTSARNVWPATVAALTRLPDRIRVQADGAPAAVVDVTVSAATELALAEGTEVWLSAKATDIHSYVPR